MFMPYHCDVCVKCCEILFYIQSITLNSKGWFSWLSQSRKLERFGSEPEIFIVGQGISLSIFLSLSISKWQSSGSCRCWGRVQEMFLPCPASRSDSPSDPAL